MVLAAAQQPPSGNDRDRASRQDRFSTYSELTHTLEQIYREVHPIAPFRKPPAREPPRQVTDPSRYCIFHETDTHHTNVCRHLKNAIEERIRNGELTRFVRTRAGLPGQAPSPQENQDRPGTSNSRRGIIIN